MADGKGIRWRSALLEGAAVLLGILIAFGIQAWWDVQRDQAEQRAYLQAMHTELEANQGHINEDLDSIALWIDRSREHLESVARPGASPTYEQVVEMMWSTGPQVPPPLARAALDDLVSSGGFQVIESPELRRALAAYQRALELDAAEALEVREYFTGEVRTYHIEHGSFSEAPWEEYVRIPETSESFRLDVDRFAGNRTYANLLTVRMVSFTNLRDTHEELLEHIEGLMPLIEGAF